MLAAGGRSKKKRSSKDWNPSEIRTFALPLAEVQLSHVIQCEKHGRRMEIAIPSVSKGLPLKLLHLQKLNIVIMKLLFKCTDDEKQQKTTSSWE